ncbi:MAG: AAA family ATPase [Planctomycetota bacterium]
MTYWRYWQLNAAPFTGDLQQPLFRGATVEEALARIDFLVSNRRSMGMLLGPSGVGKSSIQRYLVSNPPASAELPSVQSTRISAIGLGPGELVAILTRQLLGASAVELTDSTRNWHTLCDYFRASIREEVQTIVLLDDAESATQAAHEDVCRLLSLSFPITFVLAVEQNLIGAVHRNLLERTDLQIDLPGWEVSQTGEFLAWSCQRVGRPQPIFTDRAVEMIQEVSQGVARRIVQIADLSLVAGAVAQADCVDADCVQQVICELPRTAAA